MSPTSDRTTGVFPEPPATRLPTQTTGTGARYGRATARRSRAGAVPGGAERRQQPGRKAGRRVPEIRGAHRRRWPPGGAAPAAGSRLGSDRDRRDRAPAHRATARAGRARRRERRSRRRRPAPPPGRARRARPGSPSRRATAAARLSASATVSAAPARSSDGGHCGAIAHVRAVQDGAVEPRRLERVVPALRDQRSADKGDPGQRETTARVRRACRPGRYRCRRRCASPPPRRATFSPLPRSISAILVPRAGWRGATIVSSRGCSRRDPRDARRRRSPLRRDACSPRARPAGRRSALRSAASAAGSAASERGRRFQIADAGRSRRRRARGTARPAGSSCARHSANAPQHRPRSAPACAASVANEPRRQAAVEQQHRDAAAPRLPSTRLGHSSDSTQIARSGRQWSRNRSTARGRSTGTN